MPWQPLLQGDLRQRALDVTRDIIAAIAATPATPPRGPSLAGGAAGLAILHAYAEQAGLGTGSTDELLGQAVDAVAEQPLPSSLYSGFSGIAWAADHLTGGGGEGGEDANEEIDGALIEHLGQTPWQLDYDLIIGLVGHGVYALERLQRPGGRRVLELVVDRLAETAVEVAGSPGVTWLTAPHLMISVTREANPHGNYNTGLAHGVPGVVAMLALAAEAGVARDKAVPLLDRAMAWLLAQRGDSPEGAQFPYAISIPPTAGRHPVRAAWCYGDPGVAAALYITARAAGNAAWERAALETARAVAARDPDKCGVVDGGLCHGAAGLAQIYNRFYRATGETVFADAALLWTERLLAMRKPGEGVGGFFSWAPTPGGVDNTLTWQPDSGLLSGAAGIGLTLLGLATEHEPRWDRMLLTDLKPR